MSENKPTEFDDAVCDGIAAACAKPAKRHVYRAGDVVRVVEPKFVERVGYPLVWPMLMAEFEARLPEVRQAMADLIVGELPEDRRFKFNRAITRTEPDAADRDFLKGMCMAAVRIRGFGGDERSLHYHADGDPGGRYDYYRGMQMEVQRKRLVKTGTRFPGRSYTSHEGEHDYENGGLSDERTHTLLMLENGLEIEASNVELVKAAEEMYYVRNTRSVVGNSILWWADGGHGYTCDLSKAWKVPKSKAASICRDRPEQDVMVKAKYAERSTERHVDSQLFPLHPNRRRKPKAKEAVCP